MRQCSVLLRHGDCSTTRRDSIATGTCSCRASPCPYRRCARPGRHAGGARHGPVKAAPALPGLSGIAYSTKHRGLELSSYHLRPSLSDPQAKHVMFPSSYALLIPGWSFEATKGPVCARLSSPVGLINFSAVRGWLRARKGQCDVGGGACVSWC